MEGDLQFAFGGGVAVAGAVPGGAADFLPALLVVTQRPRDLTREDLRSLKLALDEGSFKHDGGFTRLNKIFEGTLQALLGELTDEIWKDAG